MGAIYYKEKKYSSGENMIDAISVQLNSADWISVTLGNEVYYYQDVALIGASANTRPFACLRLDAPTTEQELINNREQLEAYGMISDVIGSTNKLTFYCYNDVPLVNLTLTLLNLTVG